MKRSVLIKRPKATILIDSGAYSAWQLNQKIDLDSYCDFLLENQHWIGPYFNLDVIDKDAPEIGAQISFDNLCTMRRRGLDPIAIYHIEEDQSWLHRILDLGCTHLALGGTARMLGTGVHDWHKGVWANLVNSHGRPLVKVHALGNGKFSSLRQFPWASADSTSWLYTAQRTARATLDGKRQVSFRDDELSTKASRDILALSELDQQVWDEMLEKMKIRQEAFFDRGSKDGKRVQAIMRTWLTAYYYTQVQEKIRALDPIRFYPEGLFNSYAGATAAEIKLDPFKLYLVGGTNNIAYIIMAALGHPYVLASYFYIKNNTTTTHAVSVPLDRYAKDPQEALIQTPQWKDYRQILAKFTYQ